MENPVQPRPSGPTPLVRIAIILVLVLAVAGVFALKMARQPERPVEDLAKNPLPRLVDYGSDKCVPCKAMIPILDALRRENAGQLEVVFKDVVKDPEAGYQNKINLIPTQIFYDPAGKELYRHEGFFAKADILAKWKELGYEIQDEVPAGPSQVTAATPTAGSK